MSQKYIFMFGINDLGTVLYQSRIVCDHFVNDIKWYSAVHNLDHKPNTFKEGPLVASDVCHECKRCVHGGGVALPTEAVRRCCLGSVVKWLVGVVKAV